MESVILEQKENLAMLYDQNPDPKQDENSSSGDSFSFLKRDDQTETCQQGKDFHAVAADGDLWRHHWNVCLL